MTNTKILNLDELELAQSDVTIIFKGEKHTMAVLTVEAYLKQQTRAKQQAVLEQKVAEAGDVQDTDSAEMVKLLRDAIQDFFPTLPVGEMETQRLFQIFGWLNELSMQMAESGALESTALTPDNIVEDDGSSAEGNVLLAEK